MKKQILIALLFLGLSSSSAHSILFSGFDSSSEGWTVANGAKNLTHLVNEGNPGGFIHATDNAGGVIWYFASPNTWDGDWSEYIGGFLDYDIQLMYANGVYFDGPEVRIYRGSVYAESGSSKIQPPLDSWEHFYVSLTASNFTIKNPTSIDTFEEIMASVTALWIRGEFISDFSYSTPDIAGIDNVRIRPVPAPGSLLLLSSGLLGLGAVRRRRRGRLAPW